MLDVERDRVLSPDELMRRVATGDRGAFADLVQGEGGRLLAVARRIVRRGDLAEEVVQETFVTIWRKAPLFDTARGGAAAWMSVMVRNRALNLLRDSARMETIDPADLEMRAEAHAEAQTAYVALDDAEDLKRCLGQLEETRRQSILLAYVAGYSHGEIAERLRTPIGTVKAWIRRGVIALQECLS